MEKEIIPTLKSIGLSGQEAQVYLNLMKERSSTVLEVAKGTNLHRSNVYDALRRLRNKGLVEERISENRKYFVALEPERLKIHLKQKEEELNKALNLMSNLTTKQSSSYDISIKEGKTSLINIGSELLRLGKPIYSLNIPIEAARKIGGEEEARQFHQERIKREIPVKAIFSSENKEILTQFNQMPSSEGRYLQRENNNLSTTIVGDEVFFMMYREPYTILKIKNKDIAEELMSHFNEAWKKAKSE